MVRSLYAGCPTGLNPIPSPSFYFRFVPSSLSLRPFFFPSFSILNLSHTWLSNGLLIFMLLFIYPFMSLGDVPLGELGHILVIYHINTS